jgi:[acyl-carrier-protein] S-malonyltransferase
MMIQIGFVFPGQGSQAVGMLADIAQQFSEVETTFAEASAVLDYDLWELVQQGPAAQLDQTLYTQPALLAAEYAIWRIIQREPIQPVLLAGHSLGEYTALVCAQALTFVDAIQLVAARGQYMQEAVVGQAGAMAALIGLDEASVAAICREAVQSGEVLSPANFNSIGQVVIAGHREAVERALKLAKERGAKMAVLLPVSVPSHCSLMQPAAERLALLLTTITFHPPIFPIINNVDVKYYDTVDTIRTSLMRQLYMPVRWVETIQAFAQAGVSQVIECGPGKILTGLNKRINKSMQFLTTGDIASLKHFKQCLSEQVSLK